MLTKGTTVTICDRTDNKEIVVQVTQIARASKTVYITAEGSRFSSNPIAQRYWAKNGGWGYMRLYEDNDHAAAAATYKAKVEREAIRQAEKDAEAARIQRERDERDNLSWETNRYDYENNCTVWHGDWGVVRICPFVDRTGYRRHVLLTSKPTKDYDWQTLQEKDAFSYNYSVMENGVLAGSGCLYKNHQDDRSAYREFVSRNW